jgi:soluble lytic murein transglycosylase-like protein
MGVTEGLAEPTLSASSTNKLSMGSATGLKGFTTGNPLYDSYIVDSSRRYNIDPLLIYSQMHQESSFKLKALSHKGASGLMQLMPATARRLGVTSIYDPKQNIEGGVKYMRMLLDMFGQDVVLALAGYNAGEGAVMRYGHQVPPYSETREYVRRITARYNSITDGTFAANYRRVTSPQAAKLEKQEARPLTVYEPDAVVIRLADGSMRLVNQ